MSVSQPQPTPSDALHHILQSAAGHKWVFLVFSGHDCPVCDRLRQQLPWFADTYRQQLDLLLVDIRKHPSLATEYAIIGIPTVMVYRQGMPVLVQTGVDSRNELKKMLKTATDRVNSLHP